MAVAVVALSVLCGWYAVNLAMGRLADNSAGWLDSLEPVHGQWVSRTGFAEDGSTPWTTPVRVTVDGDELRFDVGCNRLSAIVTVEDHRLHSEQGVVATEIGVPARGRGHRGLAGRTRCRQRPGPAQGVHRG